MITILNICFIIIFLACAWLTMHAMAYVIDISEKWYRRLLLFAGCYLLCVMIIFIEDPVNILFTIPFFLTAILLSCRGSFWQKVTIGLMFSSTIFSFNALRDNYIPALLPETCRQIEHGFPFARLCSLPFTLMLYLYTRQFAPDKNDTLSDSMWRLLLLLTVTPLGIVLDVVVLFHPYNDYTLAQPPPEYAILLLISLFAFISLLWCIKVMARQQKLEQQNMFAEINRRYYEAMEQQHFEIRRLKHDLANHIQILSALPEDKREAYAKELAGNPALSQSFAYCGDSTVNAVLTVKKSVMERWHIHLDMETDIPMQHPYDRTDICALYANALDNAMEACMKLEEVQRVICVKSKAGKGVFCLEISNPDTNEKQDGSVSGKIAKHDLLLPTSKPDKANHGLGLKSIREIVERCHGSMEIKTENGVFDLLLYLPLTSSLYTCP